jgi:hypothetical protein
MVALTCDFHVFTSGVTANFSAVFFSAGYMAKTRYVRALFGLLIRHYHSVLSSVYVVSHKCMQLSKRRNAVKAIWCKVFGWRREQN